MTSPTSLSPFNMTRRRFLATAAVAGGGWMAGGAPLPGPELQKGTDMDTLAIDDLMEAAHAVLIRSRLDQPGQYRRRALEKEAGLNPYGVADAANLLYTLDAMPPDPADRAGFVDTLGTLQDAETGLFREKTHHPFHTTAHCIAALELFDARPPRRLVALEEFATSEGIVQLLEDLEWVTSPWNNSHRGAGVYVSLKLSRQLEAEPEQQWERAYFDWLADAFDPVHGMLRKGCLPGQADGSRPMFEHMAGTFHYLFNMQYRKVPMPYPDQTVDTCLAMWKERTCRGLASSVGFITIDWVYCLNRALRQSGHRIEEAHQALADVAVRYVTYLQGLDHGRDRGFNDLHSLFGAFCALAELQQALPGRITSRRPLRLVLDRRPFI